MVKTRKRFCLVIPCIQAVEDGQRPLRREPAKAGGPSAIVLPVAIAAGKHPFPFRTRKLSPPAPMVLPGQLGGRVGRRRLKSENALLVNAKRAFSCLYEGARFCRPRRSKALRLSERRLHAGGRGNGSSGYGRRLVARIRQRNAKAARPKANRQAVEGSGVHTPSYPQATPSYSVICCTHTMASASYEGVAKLAR